MLAVTKTIALLGLEGHVVEVEVDVSNGLPSFKNVGSYSRHAKNPWENVACVQCTVFC